MEKQKWLKVSSLLNGKLIIVAMVMVVISMSGCSSNLSGRSYSRAEARKVQKVRVGEILSLRLVAIEGKSSAVGELGGAVIGGVAASNIGKGRGKFIATVVGAILGGIAGKSIEKNATSAQGVEITIKLDNGQTVAIVQEIEKEDTFAVGDRVKILSSGSNARVAPL